MLVVREKTIELNLANGLQDDAKTLGLEDGFILGAEVHTNWRQENDPENKLSVGIFDDSGIPIARLTNIGHWKRREGAGFNESYKPLLFQANNRNVSIQVKAKNPVNANIYVDIVLIYKIEGENQHRNNSQGQSVNGKIC